MPDPFENANRPLDRIEEDAKRRAARPPEPPPEIVNAPDAPAAGGTPGGEFLEQIHRAQRDGWTSRPIVEPQEAPGGPGEDFAKQIAQAQNRPGARHSFRIDR